MTGSASPPHVTLQMDTPVRAYRTLIWFTLYGAVLHFFDNVYFFDQYPEPAWLNPPIIAALWFPLALIAHRAVDLIYAGRLERSFPLVHAFVIGNWLSLGHYLYGSPATIAPRINLIIGSQVAVATVLFVVAVWLQVSRSPESLRWTTRAWIRNAILYTVLVSALEWFWPSKFSHWWMP